VTRALVQNQVRCPSQRQAILAVYLYYCSTIMAPAWSVDGCNNGIGAKGEWFWLWVTWALVQNQVRRPSQRQAILAVYHWTNILFVACVQILFYQYSIIAWQYLCPPEVWMGATMVLVQGASDFQRERPNLAGEQHLGPAITHGRIVDIWAESAGSIWYEGMSGSVGPLGKG